MLAAPPTLTPFLKEYPLAISPREVYTLFREAPSSFLLESGMNRFQLGRFSFLGADPFLTFRVRGHTIEIREDGHSVTFQADPLDALRALLERFRVRWTSQPVPFLAGAVGHLGYDLGRHIEQLPCLATDDLQVPDCLFGLYDRALIFDHVKRRLVVASTGLPELNPDAAYRRARVRGEELIRRLEWLTEWRALRISPGQLGPPIGGLQANFTKDGYLDAVRKAKEYIAAGDIYQVNLSQRFSTGLDGDPFVLYRRLHRINPVPFGCFLDYGDVAIVGTSPERFLRLRGRRVETRPMKGTRPRGKSPEEDRYLREELLRSVKDQAELVMIVDLERNDLGRVCEYGSVRVSTLRALETYATVFQTTANIVGRMRRDRDRIDLIRASFPGGSVTGAPKIRAMEIIEELEPTRRGVYTGSIGYLDFGGDLDLNIAIRTMICRGGQAHFQVGGGIVADSDPEEEYEETLVKAKALIEALFS
ncbi:MAG: aminodeoxychorismate synthase component I [Candidatus Methylomirabilales bacterium]